MTPDQLQARLRQFSIDVIELTKLGSEHYFEEHLVRQLVRSATACNLNYAEACGAESNRDFVHKLRITLKELKETNENLATLSATASEALAAKASELRSECEELSAIVGASMRTAKNNLQTTFGNPRR